MNEPNVPRVPGDDPAAAAGAPLPPELAAALEAEAADARDGLAEAWDLAAAAAGAEPDWAHVGEGLWTDVEARLPASTHRPAPYLRRVWPAYAAAAAVALLAAVGLWQWTRPVVVVGAAGTVTAVALPDGSRVELNGGSVLRYARRYGADARTVHLRGEAFFDVARAAQPFVVETFDAEVRVLGTSFNVRAWPDEPSAATVVAVVTGRVQVQAQREDRPGVVLAPGDVGRIDAGTAAPAPADTLAFGAALAWRSGDFFFVDQPLSRILREVERRFGVVVRAPGLDDDSLTVVLERPADAEAVLRDLVAYRGYVFRAVPGGYVLERAAEQGSAE